jgi:hypothetical protein
VPAARGKIAAALDLDFIVDDVARYCLGVKLESDAMPCLVWRRDESNLPPGARRLGIEVFPSMRARLDYLISHNVPATQRPGLAARVRHRLGFLRRTSA